MVPAAKTHEQNGRVPVCLYPPQAAFLQSRATFRGFRGGRGTGKSFVGAYDLYRRAKARRLYMVVGPSYPQLRDTSMRSLVEVGRLLGRLVKIRESAPLQATVQTTDGGFAEVLLRSADDPDTLRGPNLSGIWADEASLMRSEAFTIAIACLRERGEMGWFSGTFTPKGKTHWTYDRFGTGRPNAELICARTRENPFLSPEFYDAIRGEYSGLLAAQELDGEWIDDEGQLLRFDDIRQCEAANCLWPDGQPPEGMRPELYLGVDIGRTNDLTAIWTWEKLGDVCWCREIYTLKGAPFAHQKDAIKRRLSRWVVRCVIDRGALGMQLAEELEREHPAIVEGVQLTSGVQGRLAQKLQVAFASRRVRIPDDQVLREDLQLVRKVETVQGVPRLQTDHAAGVGHADRFWAAALGYEPTETIARVASRPPLSMRR